MLDVETKAQQKTLAYLDSAFQAKTEEFNAIKDKFKLEKDAEYQQVGNYLWPTQTIEKNMHRSFFLLMNPIFRLASSCSFLICSMAERICANS